MWLRSRSTSSVPTMLATRSAPAAFLLNARWRPKFVDLVPEFGLVREVERVIHVLKPQDAVTPVRSILVSSPMEPISLDNLQSLLQSYPVNTQ